MPILRTEESGLLLIHARDVSIDPEAFRYVVLEMLEEANVEILFHTSVSDVVMNGNALSAPL